MSILRQLLDQVHHGSTEAAIQHELTTLTIKPCTLAAQRDQLSVVEAIARHTPQPGDRP